MPLAEQKMYQVQHKKTACRQCRKTVFEDDHVCEYCDTGAPGIVSRCPVCHSENYVYHMYGYAPLRGVLACVACFPLLAFSPAAAPWLPLPLIGLLFGFYGKERTECVCLDCGQGWFPYDNSDLSRLNTFVEDEKAVCTRKFRKVPKNCYDAGEQG